MKEKNKVAGSIDDTEPSCGDQSSTDTCGRHPDTCRPLAAPTDFFQPQFVLRFGSDSSRGAGQLFLALRPVPLAQVWTFSHASLFYYVT